MAEKTRMLRVRAIVEDFRQTHERSENWVAKKMGLTDGGLWPWWNRGLDKMPSPELLYLMSVAIQYPYRDLVDAALHDFGYYPEAEARNRAAHTVDREVTLLEDDDAEALLGHSERRPS